MYPNNERQFFEGSIHLIFAVVIAQGFTIAGQVFLPIENIFSYSGFLSAFALIFAYFFTATAWFGFFKSVKTFPHDKISRFTITRYGIAILNAFILYYMITLTATKETIPFAALFFLVVVYFFLIIVIHLIKSIEKLGLSKIGIHQKLQKTIGVTIVFLAIFASLLYVYELVIENVPNLKWDDQIAWNPVFLALFFGFSAWYRWIMWKERSRASRRN